MKARVKATGEIVEVYQYGKPYYIEYVDEKAGRIFHPEELDLLDDPDYWTRLEHQYAGMAMLALIIDASYANNEGPKYLVEECVTIAHALIQKLKEKEEEK